MGTFITSVESCYGHRFMAEDGYERCVTCGALYELTPTREDPTSGLYQANNGDAPKWCSNDTNMAHGYPGERHDGNADHDCNCLLCDS